MKDVNTINVLVFININSMEELIKIESRFIQKIINLNYEFLQADWFLNNKQVYLLKIYYK